jgi:hypothetical protein
MTAPNVNGVSKEQKYQSQSNGEVVNTANYGTTIIKD